MSLKTIKFKQKIPNFLILKIKKSINFLIIYIFGPCGILKINYKASEVVIVHQNMEAYLLSFFKIIPGTNYTQFLKLQKRLLINAFVGLSLSFKNVLKLNGVGYRAFLNKNTGALYLSLGYSHKLKYIMPFGVKLTKQKNEICLQGFCLATFSQVMHNLQSKRKVDVYKSKGLIYIHKTLFKKQGKKLQ